MADTNIRFKLGSSFEGEGFKACSAAIQQNRKEIQSSVRGLGELSKAFAGVSPEAEKAVGVVGKFGQAFVAGGIVGGVITLALQGLAEGVKFVAEKMKEAEAATKKYAAILKDDLLAAIGKGTESFKGLREEMSAASKEADDLLKVLNGEAAHEAANQIFKINTEKLDALATAMTDTEKGIIEATAAYKIALVKAEQKQTEANNAVETYKQKLDNAAKVKEDAANRVAETDQKLADLNVKCKEYLDKRAQVENFLATEEERFKDGSIDLRKILADRKSTSLKIKELEETYKDDVARLKEASASSEAAKRDAAAADRDFTSAQRSLNASIMKRDESTQEVELAEREGQQKIKDAQDKAVKAKEELADKEQKAADEWDEFLAGQVKKLEDATEDLADSMNDASSELEDWIEEAESEVGKGGKKPKNVKVTNPNDIGTSVNTKINMAGVHGEIKKPKKLDNATFERIKKGQASIADWKRFDRFTERENRDRQTSLHRMGSDAVRFLQNAEKPSSWLSKRDKEFQADFKTRVLPQLPKDVAANLLGQAGKHVLAKEDMKDFLGDRCAIIRYLEKLGLK